MIIDKTPWKTVFASTLLFGALTLSPTTASAKLLAYEGFHYKRHQWTEGSVEIPEGIDGLDGGFGWAGPWEERNPYLTGIAAEARDLNDDDGLIAGARIAALSYTDSQGRRLLTQPGQVRTSTVNNSWAVRPLAKPLGDPGEVVWVSFLAQGASSDAPRWSFFKMNHDGSDHYLRLGQTNSAPLPKHWGYDIVTPSRVEAQVGPVVTEPTMFLLKIEFPQNQEDPVNYSLWFDPDLSSEAELGEPHTFQTPYRQINYAGVRGRDSIDFDEIRIGTTFESVTPHGAFEENLKIARATTVRFDTEPGKEYRILYSQDGENWDRLLPAPIIGDGLTSEISFPEHLSAASVNVVISAETYTPNPSADPVLSVTDGLALHLDASATDSLSLNGLFVEEWRDAQGNEITFSPLEIPGTDTRPIYIQQGQGPNGRPTLLFDNASLDTRSPAGLSLANDITGITFFSVVMNAQAASQNIFRMSTENSDVGIRFVQFRRSSDFGINVRRLDGDPLYEIYGGQRQPNTWSIDGSMIDYASGQAFLYVNGEELQAFDGLTTGRSQPSDSAHVRVGSSTRPELANTWQGGMSEILFYNRALTHEERNTVGIYLADKYNIPFKIEPFTDVEFEKVDSVTLSFTADAGERYSVEWTNDLAGPWNDLGVELIGLGFDERVYFSMTDGLDREFFRLRKIRE